jgi:hypothetical protein
MKTAALALATCLVAACTPAPASPDPRLEAVVDRLAVEDAVTGLFAAVDDKAWDRARSAFASEVLFDMTSLTGGEPATVGPETIVEGWATNLDPVAAVHHQIGNVRVDLDGDQASLFCYGTATHFKPEEAQRLTHFVGTYDFHLIRSADGWKIDGMRYNSTYVE